MEDSRMHRLTVEGEQSHEHSLKCVPGCREVEMETAQNPWTPYDAPITAWEKRDSLSLHGRQALSLTHHKRVGYRQALEDNRGKLEAFETIMQTPIFEAPARNGVYILEVTEDLVEEWRKLV